MLLNIEGVDKAEALHALYQCACKAGQAAVEDALVDAKKALVEANEHLNEMRKRETDAVKNNVDELFEIQDNREKAEQEVQYAQNEVDRWERLQNETVKKLSKEEAAEVITLSKGKVEAVNFIEIGVNLRGDVVNTERFDSAWGFGCAHKALIPLGAKEVK